MSHFSVTVIGPNVEAQLAPYHEFECTGKSDQYVQNVDETAEVLAGYEKDTRSMNKGPEGQMVAAYEDMFYREPTEEELKQIGPMGGSGCGGGISYRSQDWGDGKGYRPKIKFLPEGWENVDVPVKEIMTVTEYLQWEKGEDHAILNETDAPDLEGNAKYGYSRVNEHGGLVESIRRTNPNAEWDWYQIGGRWSGFLKLKEGVEGHWGDKSWTNMNEADDMGRCDHTTKGNIDIAGMRHEAGIKASNKWKEVHDAKVAAGFPADALWDSWETVVARHGEVTDAARDEYHSQPIKKALQDLRIWDLDDYLVPHDQYVKDAQNSAISTYAIVHNGQWFSKGKMGWWGCSDENMTQAEWDAKVAELIDSIPDDTEITIVDCHI